MTGTYGFVLLAAGKSSRFGREPKALLPHGSKTFIEYILAQMQPPIVVVTGAHADEIASVLTDSEIKPVYNPEWEEGMSSSIRHGLAALMKLSPVEGAIFCSVDQPAVTSALFQALIEKKEQSGKSIVASAYAGTLGIPVLFDKKYFPLLLTLCGPKGAKDVIKAHPQDVGSAPFPEGETDIDTHHDYEQWRKNSGLH